MTDIKCVWCTRWDTPQNITQGAERLGNKRISSDHQDYRITKIDQITLKNPGDLKILAVTRITGANYRLRQVWKTLKSVNNNNNDNNNYA